MTAATPNLKLGTRKGSAFEALVDVAGTSSAREIVHDLWGAGFTILPRRGGDPFNVDQKDVPIGMSYEWRDRKADKGTWAFVPSRRHDGVFAPIGYSDVIEVGGLVLMEQSKKLTDAADNERIAKAHKNVEDWKRQYGGFSGGVRVWTGDPNKPPAFDMVGEPEMAKTIIAMSPVIQPQLTVEGEVKTAPIRVARYPWLQWLFDLISVEK